MGKMRLEINKSSVFFYLCLAQISLGIFALFICATFSSPPLIFGM